MKDVNYHGENLCSIAGIENTFIGKGILRDILIKLLSETSIIVAEIRRPYDQPEPLEKKANDISPDIRNLKIDDDQLTLSFDYFVKEENEKFVELFINIWFSYEQPTFSFFLSKSGHESFNSLIVGNRLSWENITKISTLYVLFKSVEEDVIWIGKSKSLEFANLIAD